MVLFARNLDMGVRRFVPISFWFTILACIFSDSYAKMNLYLPKGEVKDLFGADGMELYYIREGVVNHNAVSFIAHVQDDKEFLTFVWKAMYPDVVVPYELSFPQFGGPGHSSLVETPRPSINSSGTLPNVLKPFRIRLKCTGKEDGETIISILFKFKFVELLNEETTVELKRLKKCRKHIESTTGPSRDPVGKEPWDPKPTKQTEDMGIVDSQPPPYDHSQSTDAFYISISVVTFIIIMAVIGVRIWHARISQRQQKTDADTYTMSHVSGGPHHNQFLRPDMPNNATIPQPTLGSNASWMHFTPIINDLGTDILEIRTKLSAIAVPKSDVVLGEMLQEGTFSKIYKGIFEGSDQVLIKTVTEAASEEQTRLLLFESSLLRGMHHRNLLPIKNVVLDGPEPPLVLFPYTKGGNLKRYLRDIKFTDINTCGTLSSSRRNFEQASTQDLVEMGIQVACGMAYLAKRGLVHKDLATRNCVIDVNLKVKITDNALSRDLFPSDYCCLGDNENRPVRWLAMESLVHKIYSTASDVWSFGVLLWELQSLAATPYNDIDDFEMSAYLLDGFRLSQPINCPDHLYNIMAACWHYSSDKRPTFSELLQMLMEFNAELGEYV